MHGSGDNQPNVQKSKIQSYSVEHCSSCSPATNIMHMEKEYSQFSVKENQALLFDYTSAQC